MSAPQNTIALIFDFDDTLTDDSTTQLLKSHNVDDAKFWTSSFAPLVNDGWDPAPAYLKLILDLVGDPKPLGRVSNAALREFGKELAFYPGLPRLFKDLTEQVREHTLSNPTIEFYVISGGLEEIILGSSIATHLSAVRGCRFAETDGVISAVQNVVTFTEKTRYLFEISKGLMTPERRNPYDVNNDVAQENRRIPFSNMIYVGDGLTDVPCFSLLQKFGGMAFGVFDPKKKGSPKKAWEQLVAPKRVSTLNSPKYRKNDDLGALLRVAVQGICNALDARTRTA
jgi:phosphoserine phosphatase